MKRALAFLVVLLIGSIEFNLALWSNQRSPIPAAYAQTPKKDDVKPKDDPKPVPVPNANITIADKAGNKNIIGLVHQQIVIKATTDCTRLRWVPVKALKGTLLSVASELVPDPKTLIVYSATPGTYKIRVYGSLSDGTLADEVTFPVVIEPDPDAPDPTPGPGPNPPGPTPGPAPIPTDGFRVLIMYGAKDLAELPADETMILLSGDVRAYLNDKCAVGADGATKEWRFYDPNPPVSNETKLWQDAVTKAKADANGTYPWILVSTGKAGFSGPMPKTVADLLTLLKKYGG